MGEEGERGKEGPAIGESEMNFSASVDDKFYGSLTSAIVREDGADKIELEEAYLQSLPGLGLPTGLSLKAGRALWTLGYLNEHHAHTDDFADRPLPYRAYLNKAYNDDGLALHHMFCQQISIQKLEEEYFVQMIFHLVLVMEKIQHGLPMLVSVAI